MKTHELISLADYISKIMAHYPNKSVEYALDDILNLLEARNGDKHLIKKKWEKPNTHKIEKSSKSIKDELSKRYSLGESSESNTEPHESLNDLPLERLKKIATEIGIKTTSRQNKGILVMNISKTMERRRIDSTIQDKDKDKEE